VTSTLWRVPFKSWNVTVQAFGGTAGKGNRGENKRRIAVRSRAAGGGYESVAVQSAAMSSARTFSTSPTSVARSGESTAASMSLPTRHTSIDTCQWGTTTAFALVPSRVSRQRVVGSP
jgi:hypothetical protein